MIEMNEPPANSYGISFMRELDAAVDAAEGDEACRVVVVRSAVPGFFCGDADIKQFRSNTPAQNIEMITVAHETLGRLAGSRRIYIAEINGHALGGGLEIALACDLRFAGAGEYWLGLPEVTMISRSCTLSPTWFATEKVDHARSCELSCRSFGTAHHSITTTSHPAQCPQVTSFGFGPTIYGATRALSCGFGAM